MSKEMEMRERVKIDNSDTLFDVVVKMAEGNPGATDVLCRLIKAGRVLTMLDLDDMGMRGPQIWVAYKDHCGEDLQRFIAAVDARDVTMVATVNQVCASGDFPPAVTHRTERT